MGWRFWNGSICFLVLPAGDLSLDRIWAKYEDFCKPQTNEARARFDLLASFRQDNHSVMTGTPLYKAKYLLPSTHQKLQVSCIKIFSDFSSKMKSLFLKPSMRVIKIWISFQQTKLGSLLRRWSHQSLPHITLNKSQVTPKWLK